jgi:MFS family permease
MVDLAAQAAVQAEAAARPSIRRYYVLGLLTVVYALNFLDRTIFNVLIEPIKKEFALSDTTMDLLAGFGFVLFYSLLGIPIARLADRFNRRNIVAVAGVLERGERDAGQAGDINAFLASHALKNDFGVQAVRYSLLSAAVTTTVGSLLFIWAARSICADVHRAG